MANRVLKAKALRLKRQQMAQGPSSGQVLDWIANDKQGRALKCTMCQEKQNPVHGKIQPRARCILHRK